jgi:hypothetical protein
MIPRRSLLQRLTGLLLLGSPAFLRADSKIEPGGGVAAGITAIVDRLIPAQDLPGDDLPGNDLPGAVDLGIDQQILMSATTDRGVAAFMMDGIRWFDTAARARGGETFAALAAADQIAVAMQAEASPDSAGGRLFAVLRRQAMSLYYIHPRVTASFPYAGPPQPQGFPDFAQAPRDRP